MKSLKYIIGSISAAILLFLFVSLLLPSKRSHEYSITINQPVDSVYKRIIDLRKWQEWNPWSIDDSEVRNSYAGLMNAPGSRWIWSGDKAGEGELIIDSTEPGRSIETTLRLDKPTQVRTNLTWYFTGTNSKTEVKWVNSRELGYPFGRWAGLLQKDGLGSDFEKGLHRLKEICEREI